MDRYVSGIERAWVLGAVGVSSENGANLAPVADKARRCRRRRATRQRRRALFPQLEWSAGNPGRNRHQDIIY